MRERLQRIVADAAANYPEMCIYPAQQRGSFRSFTAGDAPHFKVFDPQPEARTSRTQIHSIQRESSLLSTAPSLYELLHRKEVTALIALNDAYAADFMHRIRAAGMRVPEDVSLVSFDNSLQSQLLHLTSVDFNAQLHGYLLAHLFIKDIPVATTPNGEVPIGSFLSDRNSVVSIH
jgi:DNA-binding LacI/PurR family transcriptional regulator